MEKPGDDANKKKRILGPNNLGVGIIEVGEGEGEEDDTIRPLRESLRKLLCPDQGKSGTPDS